MSISAFFKWVWVGIKTAAKNPKVQKAAIGTSAAVASGVVVHKIDKKQEAKRQELQDEQFKQALRKQDAVINDLSTRAEVSEERNERLLQRNQNLNDQLEKMSGKNGSADEEEDDEQE